MQIQRSEAIFYILNRIKDIRQERGSCIVAIDGNSGSGKSTVAAQISAACGGATVIHMDDFFLPFELRTTDRLAEPGGNIDYERFNNEVIKGISSGRSFSYRVFSCSNGTYSLKKAFCSPVYIIEGVYSLHPHWINSIDLKIFFKIDAKTQQERILYRNGPEMLRNFTEKWIPMENSYFNFYKIAENCELTVI